LSDTALTGHQVDRARKFLADSNKPCLVVVNYDRIWRTEMARFIDSANFECVVADECHKLKGRSSKRSIYLRTAWKRHPYRIALTGTPMSNGVLTDAFGQYAFLDPGIYGGSITRFEDRYVVKHRQHQWLTLGYRNTEDFYRRFWWIARHEDRSVLTLPPLTETVRTVHLPQEARRAYAAMRDELIVQIREGIVTASNAAVAISKLQQMASGTVIAVDGSNMKIHQEKQSALEEVLLETGTSPVVVFAIFKNDLAAIHDAAKAAGVQSLELSGRRDELARWQDGEATVLAVQVQSGSEGISLVRAQYGVFFSPSYNLSQMDQAKARLHRPGQEHAVSIIHLIADNTVDNAISSSLSKKRNFVQDLLDSRGSLLVSLDN
jgi:SNF2 family DNA or RNA helicase